MLVNQKNINEMTEYLEQLEKIRQYFKDSFIDIKDTSIKRLVNNILDKIYDLRSFMMPDEFNIKEKIDDIVSQIIDEYYSEISSFNNFNNDIFHKYITKKDDDLFEVDYDLMNNTLQKNNLQYSEEGELNEIIYKISDRILTHVAFINQNNPKYYENISELENFIREEVKKDIENLSKNTNELYNDVVYRINSKKNNLIEQIISYQNNRQQEILHDDNSSKENEYSNNQRETLELEPVFDVEEKKDSNDLSKENEYSNNQRKALELEPVFDVEDKKEINDLSKKIEYLNNQRKALELEPVFDVEEKKEINNLSTNNIFNEYQQNFEINEYGEIIRQGKSR